MIIKKIAFTDTEGAIKFNLTAGDYQIVRLRRYPTKGDGSSQFLCQRNSVPIICKGSVGSYYADPYGTEIFNAYTYFNTSAADVDGFDVIDDVLIVYGWYADSLGSAHKFMLRSVDGGKHWTEINVSFRGNQIFRSRLTSTGRLILVSRQYGNDNGIKFPSILYTDDKGVTWHHAEFPSITNFSTEHYKFNSPATFIELPDGRLVIQNYNYPECAFWYSVDKGATWAPAADIQYNGTGLLNTLLYDPSVAHTLTFDSQLPGEFLYFSGQNGTLCYSTDLITWLPVQFYDDPSISQDNIPLANASVTGVTTDGKIIISQAYSNMSNRGLWVSERPIVTYKVTKYLDHKGARELVAQFKTYVDSLVGGNP